MNMSTFCFIASILFAFLTLGFTMVGISMEDSVAVFMGQLMGSLVILFIAVGLILTMKGE
jgi:4-amino-4-deoxy-L-arabinose transferase-like glycosyltransferase